MNILNRPMFSQGDEVTEPKVLPLYEKHAKGNPIVDEEGEDKLFDSFLDRYGIDAETYASIHQQAGNYVIYDPGLKTVAPGLELLFGGKGLGGLIKNVFTKQGTKGTGRYVGERSTLLLPGGIAAPPTFKEITEQVTKLTPLGKKITVGGSLPFVAGSARMPEDSEITGEETFIARNQDEVQAEIDLLKANNKKDLENKRNKAKKQKDLRDIKTIEEQMSAIVREDTKKSEAYQEIQKRKRSRNTGIFLEEMALSMAGTTNLADGLAIGAANAASKVGDADEAEALAYLELEKEAREMEEGDKLKETTATSLIEKYSDSMAELDGSKYVLGRLNDLESIYKQNPRNVTGIMGFLQGIGTDFAGAFNLETGELKDRSKAKNITELLKSRLVTQLLGEKGKTISDADRKLVADLIGNLSSPVSNVDSLMNLLSNVKEVLANSTKQAQGKVTAFEKRYEKRIPEFADIRNQYKISGNNYEIPEDDDEVSIADDPTMIQ